MSEKTSAIPFARETQHFEGARSCLLLPMRFSQDKCFELAINECREAFRFMKIEDVKEEEVRTWLNTLHGLMGSEPSSMRAAHMGEGEKVAFSGLIDDLAKYFSSRMWGYKS